MPRQSRGPSAAPRRPVAAPARPSPPSVPQTRQASTSAVAPPPAAAQAPSQGSGLFGQMASTAAGVAVGSSIGHAIGGFFGGGSNSTPVQEAASPQQAQEAQQAYGQASQFSSQQQGGSGVCGNEVTGFKRCMDENQGNLTICGWYLDQLKACQSAASQY